MKKLIILLMAFGAFCYLISTTAKAQNLTWKGTVDNDFFNELNWQNSSTLLPPSAGTIDPGVAIPLSMSINNATNKVVAKGDIFLGDNPLSVEQAWLEATSISYAGAITIWERGYIDLTGEIPIIGTTQINLQSGLGWIRTYNYNPTEVFGNLMSRIRISGASAVYQSNLRLDNYYLNGCVIRSNSTTETSVKVYSGSNLTGLSTSLTTATLHTAFTLTSLYDNIESFVLQKGYMMTVATHPDGTGKSKVYIASEEDLVVNTLPTTLQNSISFIRVLPWNWVNKKGVTNQNYTLNAQWRYDWGDSALSITNRNLEFTPMSWMSTGTTAPRIATRIAAYGTTHIMSFNEPDNLTQSGQYNNFTDFNAAVPFHKELMKIGCRIVSPGCLEDGVFGYLDNFNTLARLTDTRMDAISIHWSDWGNYTADEGTVTGLQIFNRFKVHLKKVYDTFGLPIWITEFNANPNRSAAVQSEFMTLALPYLESLDYVERYNWFQSANGNSDLYVGKVAANGLTPLGTIYQNQVSTPSIPERIVNERNNLNLKQ